MPALGRARAGPVGLVRPAPSERYRQQQGRTDAAGNPHRRRRRRPLARLPSVFAAIHCVLPVACSQSLPPEIFTWAAARRSRPPSVAQRDAAAIAASPVFGWSRACVPPRAAAQRPGREPCLMTRDASASGSRQHAAGGGPPRVQWHYVARRQVSRSSPPLSSLHSRQAWLRGFILPGCTLAPSPPSSSIKPIPLCPNCFT